MLLCSNVNYHRYYCNDRDGGEVRVRYATPARPWRLLQSSCSGLRSVGHFYYLGTTSVAVWRVPKTTAPRALGSSLGGQCTRRDYVIIGVVWTHLDIFGSIIVRFKQVNLTVIF